MRTGKFHLVNDFKSALAFYAGWHCSRLDLIGHVFRFAFGASEFEIVHGQTLVVRFNR
jgi:hypothetical protein